MSNRHSFLVTATLVTALTFALGGRVALSQEATALDQKVLDLVEDLNVQLRAQGADIRVAHVDYITDGKSGHGRGRVHSKLVPKDKDGRFASSAFVPFDPRRAEWSGPAVGRVDDITYAIDQSSDAQPAQGNVSARQATRAIRKAMRTWDRVNCSGLNFRRIDTGTRAIGFASRNSGIVADVMHSGFRDLKLGEGFLALTVTYVFGVNGVATDIDKDGRTDVAAREIFYNPAVIWSRGAKEIDIESIALHEMGHALSLEHLGEAVVGKGGTTHFVPKAVMNATYTQPMHSLHQADIAQFCGKWSNWGPVKVHDKDLDDDDDDGDHKR